MVPQPDSTLKLRLYRRETCSLCSLAEAVLAEIGIEAEICYLEDDAASEQRYGWRIPVVLRTDTDAELDWPFDALKLRRFLGI